MTVVFGNFINGQWGQWAMHSSISPATLLHIRNPGDLAAGTVATYGWHLDEAHQAVAAARAAFPAWRGLGIADRARVLRQVQDGFKERKEDLAYLISLEMGKPIVESRTEVDAMIRKFDITLPDAASLLAPHQHPDEPKTYVRGEPLGVAAVVGPFNFPGHLVNGMVLPALATGNTVVLKPASVSPGVWRLAAEIFQGAGLPAGVLNYVVGDRRIGQALAEHEDVDLLLFTGGVAAGRSLKAAAANTHKEVKLEMGGQGVALVLEDADIEKTADLIAKGATVRGGQNCNATRNVFAVGARTAEKIREALVERLRKVRVGTQFTPNIDYGPLAMAPSSGFRRDLEAVLKLGASIFFEGALPEGLPEGYYAAPILYRRPKETFLPRDASEIFGPALGLTEISSVEEGLSLMNGLHLRLSAAIHSADLERAREIALGSRWGQTVINGMTVGASSYVDFAGMGEATYGGAGGRAMTEHTVARVNVVEPK